MPIMGIEDKLEKIHINCYKLFLRNIEMKYLFEDASHEELDDKLFKAPLGVWGK